jgi:hypothetical protein
VFDKAGHVIANGKHTYTLPYGYKHFNIVNNNNNQTAKVYYTDNILTADNTQDTLKIEAINNWIALRGVEDLGSSILYLGHKMVDEDGNFGNTYYAKGQALLNDDSYK